MSFLRRKMSEGKTTHSDTAIARGQMYPLPPVTGSSIPAATLAGLVRGTRANRRTPGTSSTTSRAEGRAELRRRVLGQRLAVAEHRDLEVSGGEDFDVARDSARRLAARDFEVAVFGHGEPLTEGASAQFRQAFSS